MTPEILPPSSPWRETPEAAALAERIVESWACLDKYPFEKPAQARLAKALLQVAESAEHARAIGAAFSEACPRPKDIMQTGYRLAHQNDESPVERMRREFIAEVRRAFRDHDAEALEYYQQQQPAIVAQVRREEEVKAS